MISVVIPTLNAGGALAQTLEALVPAAMEGLVREVVAADGGSTDATLAILDDAGARVLHLPPNRGAQLAAACATARGTWLLALHADTRLERGWETAARRHMAERPHAAGWFRFWLDDPSLTARVWEAGVSLRSGLFGLPYGDQGLLISKALYGRVGGYRPLSLMEDVDLVRRLGRARLAALPARALTSAERFRREGYWRRSGRNWRLLAAFLRGADPAELARRYG